MSLFLSWLEARNSEVFEALITALVANWILPLQTGAGENRRMKLIRPGEDLKAEGERTFMLEPRNARRGLWSLCLSYLLKRHVRLPRSSCDWDQEKAPGCIVAALSEWPTHSSNMLLQFVPQNLKNPPDWHPCCLVFWDSACYKRTLFTSPVSSDTTCEWIINCSVVG